MKYDIIYTDPPWSYKRTKGQGCKTKYKRLSDEDIYNLPIKEIANDNCALLCWMTFPKLAEGIRAIESWGFSIKTVFVNWIKTNPKNNGIFFGIGSYTRSNGEVLMLCEKGKVSKLRYPKNERTYVSSILMSPRRRHSEKPSEVRGIIENIFKTDKRIEIFARERVDDWDSIGYGVDSMDIRESLPLVINDKYDKQLYEKGADDI